MATEDRVKVLEGEFKLIKNELRQTLGSVRDFLLELKLPPMQEEPGVIKDSSNTHDTESEQPQQPEDDQSGSGDTAGNGDNGFGGDDMPQNQDQIPDFSSMAQPQEDQSAGAEKNQEEPASESLPPLDFDSDEDNGLSSGDVPGQNNQKSEPVDLKEGTDDLGDAAADDETVNEQKETAAKNDEASELNRYNAPQVNLLANVIRWVSLAKKQIGSAQLPVFLDVYAATGSLNPEMKDLILHLAEVATSPELADETPESGQVISEQLKLCMEINRSSGDLPDDVRLKIQRLTELLLQQSISYNKADVWSMLLVDLHGVLAGGGSTIRMMPTLNPKVDRSDEDCDDHKKAGIDETEPSDLQLAEDEPLEVETIAWEAPHKNKPNNLKGTRPARLRLILPLDESREQELDLGNLCISRDSKPKNGNGNNNPISMRKRSWL